MALAPLGTPDHPLSVVGVSGSLHTPSKTTALVTEILDRVGAGRTTERHLIELDRIGPDLAGAIRRDQLPATVEDELRRIETADLLVVASPVYRASFTGLFKHLFDFVGQYDAGRHSGAARRDGRKRPARPHHRAPVAAVVRLLSGRHLAARRVRVRLGLHRHRVSNPELLKRIDLAVARARPLISREPVTAGRPAWW